MSNYLWSNEIRELIHEPNKIDCDSESHVVANVDFSDEASLQYFCLWNQLSVFL